ncbi:predicted protein [Uncinocarpus reesii 1704]|uniref:Uncharacterized protein n=1 Tax=Uncinocarpus reesii (strain UAMH 1704) TaxID=336963 RepID=C4JDD3_UNCRE|nr:uncharacterized protein UREG_00693 [Uncinocarpus reesii 1704]EEP75846.1 predicted protein [Uncinocarpus reesii 1704]
MSNNYYASASGIALIGDGTANLVVTYKPDGAVISSPQASTASPLAATVFVPLPNPPNTNATLKSVSLEIDTTGSAEITEVYVYFGKTLILDSAGRFDKDHIIDATKSAQKPDDKPYGITVALDVNIPNAQATISIHSVSLDFQG